MLVPSGLTTRTASAILLNPLSIHLFFFDFIYNIYLYILLQLFLWNISYFVFQQSPNDCGHRKRNLYQRQRPRKRETSAESDSTVRKTQGFGSDKETWPLSVSQPLCPFTVLLSLSRTGRRLLRNAGNGWTESEARATENANEQLQHHSWKIQQQNWLRTITRIFIFKTSF